MMRLGAAMAAALAVAMIGGAARAEDPAGDWKGVITTPAGPLHVAIHLHAVGAGAYGGTADSPDQGAFDLPLAGVVANGDAISFSLPSIHGSYAGKWDPATHQWAV